MSLPFSLAPVQNDTIAAMGYDEANEHLYVQYVPGGAVWRYCEIAPNLWRLLQRTATKGTFIEKSVFGRYTCQKLEVAA